MKEQAKPDEITGLAESVSWYWHELIRLGVSEQAATEMSCLFQDHAVQDDDEDTTMP